MSAYDNPTIIKDNSGMILAQGITAFSENFEKARAARDAKLLEQAKLLEKKRKEADELILRQQTLRLESDIYNNKQTSNTLSTISKTDTELQKQIGGVIAKNYSKSGTFAMEVATIPQTEERLQEISTFNQNLEVGKDNAVKMAGGILANQTEYDAMGSDAVTNIVWNGTDQLEKFSNQVTFFAMNPKNLGYAGKIEKKYTSDENNPSLAKLNLKTNIGSEAEAIKAFANYFPNDTPTEKIKEALDKGISDGKITKNDKQEFIINFEKQIGEGWDYSFYRKIPKATQGTELDKDHGNVLDTEKGGLFTKFLYNNGVPKTEDVKVSEGLSKNKKTAYVETVYANVNAIKQASSQYYNFNIQGLMQSDFKDISVWNGFLQNRLKLPDMTVDKLRETYKTDEKMIEFMANQAMSLDLESRLTSTNAGGGKTWTRRLATPKDVENKIANKVGDDVYESKSEPIVYAKDMPADNKLTPGQQLDLQNRKQRLGLITAWEASNDTDTMESIDGSKMTTYDPASKKWMISTFSPSSGEWKKSTQTGYNSKAEAAKYLKVE
jgi:hypothetical protein